MENNFSLSDDLLWDYADGFLSAEEKLHVEAYLRQYPEWQERLNAIRAEQRAFAAMPLQKPNPGFADRVMAAWATETHAAYSAKNPGKDWIVYLISSVLGLFICAAFLIAGMQAAPSDLPVELPQVPQVPAYEWSVITGNPALQYGVYLVLTLALLKLVERYLHQRRVLDQLKRS